RGRGTGAHRRGHRARRAPADRRRPAGARCVARGGVTLDAGKTPKGHDVNTTPTEIFAVGRGQYENIGDIILRRPLLDWAREAGRLHVYVGDSPAGYDEGLGLQPEDRVYRSFRQWYAALVKAAVAGNAHSIYKPGEVQ